MSVLKVKKIREDSKLPEYDSRHGYIIYADEDMILEPKKPNKVCAGFSMSIPINYCAMIMKHCELNILPGLIDSDYRGEISCTLIPREKTDIRKGDAIGRMLVIKVALPEIIEEMPDSKIGGEETASI